MFIKNANDLFIIFVIVEKYHSSTIALLLISASLSILLIKRINFLKSPGIQQQCM